jgi:hypothetical protein
MAFRAKELSHEITLRVSDRTKTLSHLHSLMKQFGGEIIRAEEDFVLASLPVASVSKFERDLAEFDLPRKTEKLSPQKDVSERFGAVSPVKKRDGRAADEGSLESMMDSKERVIVRILLVPE